MENGSVPLFAIEDYTKVGNLFKPQKQVEHKALHPDCAFVFAQSNSYFLSINVAMDEEGHYHFGYGLYEPEHGGGCWPSSHWKDHKKAYTLKGCLINALNHIKGMRQLPHPIYVRKAIEAIAIVERSRIVQPSLFDFIDC